MTIADLLRTQPTISQLDMLARADRHWFGRYYGGQLLTSDVRSLTDGLEIRKSLREQIDALPSLDWVPVEHTCISCGQPCGCDQVDRTTGLGCRECIECNIARAAIRDADALEQLPVMIGSMLVSRPLAEELCRDGILKAVHAGHKCKGCGEPCDCGRPAASCLECASCSIPF